MDRKVRVGIDARMIHHSGIGTYLRNLLRELPALSPGDFEFVLFGRGPSLECLNGFYSVRPFTQPIYSVSEQLGYLPRTASVDVWHSPHYNIPFFCGSRLVVTLHDLIPLIFAGRFFSSVQRQYVLTFLRRILKQACRIVTVSEQTKQDVMAFFKVSGDRIRVIPEGVSRDFRVIKDPRTLDRVRQRYGLPLSDRFLLYVGLLKPHKNLSVLIETVRRLRREGKMEQKLLIVGAKDRKYPPESRYLGEIQTDQDIVYIERADQGDLPYIYNAADLFILPSLYEGFGLPVLEAFACGTPVIVSDRGSLPEVAGDAALRFEADSQEKLAEAILRMLEDSALRGELREKGFERARAFSWTQMAEETLKVYKEAALLS